MLNNKNYKYKQTSHSLTMTSSTWEKDSHGLYDYEASKPIHKKFRIEDSCKIFRNWKTAETILVSNQEIKKGMLPDEDFHFLASVNKSNENEGFFLSCPESPPGNIMKQSLQIDTEDYKINTSSYLVVKSLKSVDGKSKNKLLIPGDILKLGRVEFVVKELNLNGQSQLIQNLNENEPYIYRAQQLAGVCKFCLSDELTENNFLLSPCNCKGSCQSVHINCLKQWIDSKIKKQLTGMVITYNFSKFECQICKTPFPKIVIKNDKKFNMLNIEKPNKPFVILQTRGQHDEKTLHIISSQQNKVIKIGRGHQCQIRLADISVSRMHAQVRFSSEGFSINDNNSKFGTLVQLMSQLKLNNQIQLQCGRTIYTFNMDYHYPKTMLNII